MPTRAGHLSDDQSPPLTRREPNYAPHEARRAQLLKAAIRCFAAQGYHATAMDTIAQESGLSKESLCRLFESKEDLLIAILDDCEAGLNKRWASWSANEDPLHRLRDYGQAVADQMAAQRKLTSVWLEFFHDSQKARERIRKLHAAAHKRLSAGIGVGVRSRALNAVSPMQAADALLAMLEGLFAMTAVDPAFDPRRRFAEAWSVIEAGLWPDRSDQHLSSERRQNHQNGKREVSH